MNNITLHNYEAYLLDYSEGTLPVEDVAELLLFIETNPNLKIDLNDFGLTYLPPSNEQLTSKEYLYHFPKIEELVIGYIESSLTPAEQLELDQLELRHKEISVLKHAYSQTILPQEIIEHPNKKSLKKTRVIPLYWMSAAAAAIFIGLLWTIGFDSSDNGKYTSAFYKQEILQAERPKALNISTTEIDTVQPTPFNIVKKPKNSSKNNLATTPINQTLVLPTETVKKDSSTKLIESSPKVIKKVQNNNIALTDKDSVYNEVNHHKTNDSDLAKNNTYTVKEFLKVKTKEIVLKEQNPTTAPINGNEILASLAENLNTKTKMEVAYLNEETDNKKITKFKLGKIEFYKSSSK